MIKYIFFLSCFMWNIYPERLHAQNPEENNALLKIIAQTRDPIQKAYAYNEIAASIRPNHPDSAFRYAQLALEIAEREEHAELKGLSYLNMGLCKTAKAEYALLKSYADKAYEIAVQQNHDSLIALTKLAYTSYYYNKSDYDKAIQNGMEALQIFETQKNGIGVLKAKVAMAQVYQLKNDLPRAEKIIQSLIDLPGIPLREHLTTMHTLANVYGMQGKYDAALALDKTGLEKAEQANANWAKSMFYDNMANCYMYSNQFELAEEYFYKSLAIDSASGNKKQMSDTYLNLGSLYNRQNKNEIAIQHFLHSIELSSATGYREGTYQAYFNLSDAYQKQGQPNEAIRSLRIGQKIKDSIFNESSEHKIAELETLYEIQKKEQQLTLQRAKIKQTNFLVWGLVALIGFIFAVGFSFYRRKQFQNKMAIQEAVMHEQTLATKSILMAEENQRSRIAAELHDGVGQLISAAKMNLSAIENDLKFESEQQKSRFENLIKMVDEGCEEIRNVSHLMMPNAVSTKGLENALRKFVRQIDQQLLSISLHIEGVESDQPNHNDAVLYRVIQECVNNVLKHAQAKRLDISLMKSAEGIDITIEDDGIGYDTSSGRNKEGLGLQNIRSRIKYLNGSLEIDSRIGKGTLIVIHIPK